jgi:hypothetical protein
VLNRKLARGFRLDLLGLGRHRLGSLNPEKRKTRSVISGSFRAKDSRTWIKTNTLLTSPWPPAGGTADRTGAAARGPGRHSARS